MIFWSGRDLRYYRIGIKMSILLHKSIVSVSYQYRNFSWESINISIGIEILDIESISISIGIDFLNIKSQAQYHSISHPSVHLRMPTKWQILSLFGQEMGISKPIFGISAGIEAFQRSISIGIEFQIQIVSVSVSVSKVQTWRVSVSVSVSSF